MPLRYRRGYAVPFHHSLPNRHLHSVRSSPPEMREWIRTATQPVSTGFELVGLLRGFTHRFLAYTFPSR